MNLKMTRLLRRAILAFMFSCCILHSGLSGQDEDQTKKQGDPKANDTKKVVIKDEPKTIDPASLIFKPLAQKFSVEFDETSIREVVAWIRSETEITVLLDESDLSDANILLSEPVTDQLQDEPLYLLLDRLQSIGLGWFVEDGILHITTATKAAESLTTIPHNVGEFFDNDFDPDDLIATIIGGTESINWEDEGGLGTIVLLGDVLFVRQSEQMHRRVSGLLKALEEHGRRTFIGDPAEHEELRNKLKQKVTVDFKDVPLSEAINQLIRSSGAKIRIDQPAFRASRIRAREPVSLKLTSQKLDSVLDALLARLRLTWTLRNGAILVTTQEAADEMLKTAVFDVRDLSRDFNESEALREAIMMQTRGDWLDDGGNGAIEFAKPGVLVVRQTEHLLGEVLNQLQAYREALKSSKLRDHGRVDPKEKITEYYRMPTIVANDFERVVKVLVEPKSWMSPDHPDATGTLLKVASRPAVMNASGTVTKDKTLKEGVSVEGGILLDYSVLIIEQSRENQEKIANLLQKVEHGDVQSGGGMGGMGGGGFGGGLFSLPGESSRLKNNPAQK